MKGITPRVYTPFWDTRVPCNSIEGSLGPRRVGMDGSDRPGAPLDDLQVCEGFQL